MDVRLLGPVEASVDGRVVAVGAGKPRALLAILSLHAGSTVSSERLIDGLWGDRPPATAGKLVQLHVSQLRKAFDAAGDGGKIVTRGKGYELRLRPDDLDVSRFERLMAGGRPREALALWRGPPLDDVAGEPFAAAEVRRLEELRLSAVELAIDRDLAAGRHRDVVGELERLVIEEPLRERLHEQRMLALYGSGRQAEALEAYRQARTALAEHAGVEPGPELRRLQEAMLRQDPSLELAARRLGRATSRLEAARPALRAAEADVAGDVYELQAARERVLRPSGGVIACPFKGLAPFDVDDAELFFGRERLVADLIARLTGARLTGIVGPSGSGKSSALRAGLLAALAAGVLPGSEGWGRALLRPGDHPMAALERAVSQVAANGRLVVAVDQFEELFTACPDEYERTAFADALTTYVRDRRGTVVLVAVRADFYGRCTEYPELSRLLGASHVLVGPMRRDELRRAIELPARHAGLEVEPELVDALLADVEGEPGGLPLLSTALVELWQHRDGRRLPTAAYEHAGGVRGAVARLAERAYERLDPERRRLARGILLRLAGESDGGAVVRRRVPLDELDGEGVSEVLAVLAHDRLVTIGEGEVEVAHEALLREWPRLRGWLDEDREGRRVHRRLSESARAWSDGGRDRGDLYRGARLASALEWWADHAPELNATEEEFLAAGRAAADRARRRLRLAFAGAVALLVLVTGAVVVALDQRGRAQEQARLAEAQALGARAQSEPRLDRSLLLARQAVALDDAPAGRDSLLDVLRRSPAAIGVMQQDGGVTTLALHPDGRTLALGDDDGTVMLLDTVTRRQIGRPHQTTLMDGARVTSLAFSPDGTRLASAAWEPGGAIIDLYDGHTGSRVRQVAHLPTAAEASVHFSPDSRVLAAQDPDADRVESDVPRWDARTGAGPSLPQSAAVLGGSSIVLGFLGSAARLVTFSEQEGATAIRDSATLRTLRRFTTSGSTAALSPAGGLVAYGAWDGSVRLLDLRTGRLRTARGGHEAPVVAMRFSRDGARLATVGRDERLIVWDPVRAIAVERLEASGTGLVQAVELGSGSRTAYSAGRDGTVIVWDVAGTRRWERPFAAHATPWVSRPLATGASGSHFAVIDARGFVSLFASDSLRPTGRIRPSRYQVTGAAISRDGRTVATTTSSLTLGALEFWDARTRRRLGPPQPQMPHPALVLAFSQDGRWLAVGGLGGLVKLWDVRRREEVGSAVINAADVAFSPDGTMLAAPLLDGVDGLRVVSVPSLDEIATVKLPVGTVVRFAADGRSLIYGDRNGRLWTVDTRTWTPRGRPLDAGAPILTADLSPDGRLLATTSTDGTGRLWDVASRRPIGAALSSRTADPIGAAFIRGGTHLAVMHAREGVVWDVRPASWSRHACTVAGRALTRSEWANALPQHEYAPACSRP
jgi:DNA-binding SARP family transcriptional activator/WD40 repeat protein